MVWLWLNLAASLNCAPAVAQYFPTPSHWSDHLLRPHFASSFVWFRVESVISSSSQHIGAVLSVSHLAIKEQRISELRTALHAVMAERSALQAQLHDVVGRGVGDNGGGLRGGGYSNTGYLQLQQELVESRSQLMGAQKKLFSCQQQLSKSQVGTGAGRTVGGCQVDGSPPSNCKVFVG
jgi:hypothetical protein